MDPRRTSYDLALIGFGVVGQGLASLLLDAEEDLAQAYGCRFSVVAITDVQKGTLVDADGLDLRTVLASVDTSGRLGPDAQDGLDPAQVISGCPVDVVVEASYTDLQTGQPALDYVRTALRQGKHVVTTNKGPVALAHRELQALADQQGVHFGFEGTVMSGTPVLNAARYGLAGNPVHAFRGILNGTTNFILDQMSLGRSYADALADAQALGYAEADPTGDVDGWDALAKVVILSNVVMGTSLGINDVPRQGISHLTPEDVQAAASQGKCWKLIGQATRSDQGVQASVGPEMVPLSDPLSSVKGATNAITYRTARLDDVTVVGPGAGREETGYALLNDLLAVHRECTGPRPRLASPSVSN